MTNQSSPVRAAIYYWSSLLTLNVSSVFFRQYKLVGLTLAQFSVFVGLPLLFTASYDMRPVGERFRLRRLSAKGALKSVGLGIIGWAMAQAMGFSILAVVERLGGRMPQTYQVLTEAPFLLALLTGALLPALCEEFAFRGYILGNLAPLGTGISVVLTALLFGMMHATLIRLLPLTLLGLIWARVAQRTGSIFPGMIMHFLNNGIALSLSFWLPRFVSQEEVPRPATTTSIGIAAAIALLLVLAAWAIAKGFGPEDLADPDAAGREEAHSPARMRPFLLALVPAMLMYGLFAYREIMVVFSF